MYADSIGGRVLVIYSTRLLGDAVAALLRKRALPRLDRPVFDAVGLKGWADGVPPILVLERGLPGDIVRPILARFPGAAVLRISPDRPVGTVTVHGLEWPLAAEHFLPVIKLAIEEGEALSLQHVVAACVSGRALAQVC
ncbi:MAG: hypothetical protein HYY01_12070 [Chloroflexi bacterium]|nr:hypothetical protein [Chloroflexota bacterium]